MAASLSLLAALCLLLGGGTAASLTPAELKKKIAEEKAQLDGVRKRLESQKQRIARSEQAERSVLEEIEELDASLEVLAAEVRIRDYQLALARERLAAAERRRRELDGRLAKREADLRLRLRSLYKGVGAPASLLAWMNSGVAEAARMRVYAHQIAQADARLIRSVREERRSRDLLTEVIRSEARALAFQKEQGEAEEVRLRAARQRKGELLASVRRRRDRQRQVYEELQRAAGRLQKLLDQWVLRAEGALPRTFRDRKGLLPWPVSGEIIGRFDPVQHTSPSTLTFGSGITLAARRGEPVRAVGPGKVIYADRLSGYGNLLVLDHGESFYTVYAHGALPAVHVGDRVDEGQTIARVGEGGALGRPALYFEVRRGGRPVDPLQWLKVRTP